MYRGDSCENQFGCIEEIVVRISWFIVAADCRGKSVL